MLIEAFNQLARRNRERRLRTSDLRQRTADAVLALLGGRRGEVSLGETADVIVEAAASRALFAREETAMIQGVLGLADRPVLSVMTPRGAIDWLDIEDDAARLRPRSSRSAIRAFPSGAAASIRCSASRWARTCCATCSIPARSTSTARSSSR